MGTSVKERLLSEVLAERRSTPKFAAQPIDESDLRLIIAAGIEAPSGFNLQPWRFVVVRSLAQRGALRSASLGQAKVEQAPVVIVACGDSRAWRDDIDQMLAIGEQRGFDSGATPAARARILNAMESLDNLEAWINRQVMIALTTMTLMAEVLGYDTALVEGFDRKQVCDILSIPQHVIPICLLCIGQRAGDDKPHGGRFPVARTVFYERWASAEGAE